MSRILTVVSKHISKPLAANNVSSGAAVVNSLARVNAVAHAAAVNQTVVANRLATTVSNSDIMSIANRYIEFAQADSQNMYELCAVPKKKISPHKRRLRQAGNWAKQAKRLYKPYQICLLCNKPKSPQTICNKQKEGCMSAPRI